MTSEDKRVSVSRKTLSVVVCNYNHARFLPEALEAILGQSFRPLEVIVIDDCSTDDSVAVIETFMRMDPIVRLYRNERNQGALVTANRGLELAAGEYIYWGAADDRILPGLFEKSMLLLASYPHAGICSSLLQMIGADGKDRGWIKSPVVSSVACYLSPERALATLTQYGFWFTGQTAVYRRDAILADCGGYVPELAHRADHFVDMVVALKYGACFMPEVLATYRILDSGYAETSFDNEELSRATFAKIVGLMRSPKYIPIFPEKLVSVFERRGWYDLEVRTLRRIIRSQMEFIGRLKALRPEPTLLDRAFLGVLKLQAALGASVARAYLWHRRINWDLPWLAMKLKAHFSRHARGVSGNRI